MESKIDKRPYLTSGNKESEDLFVTAFLKFINVEKKLTDYQLVFPRGLPDFFYINLGLDYNEVCTLVDKLRDEHGYFFCSSIPRLNSLTDAYVEFSIQQVFDKMKDILPTEQNIKNIVNLKFFKPSVESNTPQNINGFVL